MSEIPRLRVPQTATPSQSSSGPHFALSAFPAQAHAIEPVLPPRAVAVGSGLNEPSADPARFAAMPIAPVELAAIGLKKNYRKGPVEIPVLGGVDLEVRRGEFLAIIGQSGSGKSTLLHLLGTLDAPTAGEVHFDGRRIDNLPAAERDHLRNTLFGMIFQFYHLLPEMTMLENVLSPLMIRHGLWNYRRHRREHLQAARELLELVGLSHRLKHRPRELSGGEMQRTAIARALISGPKILLADEPTGNLDVETGQEILRILRTLNRTQNLSIVMVTHDTAIAAEADRIVRLAAGRVERL
jgi:lipoprotein-releasing system ATP-binding protein